MVLRKRWRNSGLAMACFPVPNGSLAPKQDRNLHLLSLRPELQRLPACLFLCVCTYQRSQSLGQANAFMFVAAVICLHYQEQVHLISVRRWGTVTLLSKFYYPRHTAQSSFFSTPPHPCPPHIQSVTGSWPKPSLAGLGMGG